MTFVDRKLPLQVDIRNQIQPEDVRTMSLSPSPTVTLANGVEMPQIALGTWPMKG